MSKSEILLVERVLDGSVDKAWDAWADPEKLAQWWRTKSIERMVIDEYDFRPGGTWRQHAIVDGFAVGENNPGVIFKEIVPLEKIVTVPKSTTQGTVVLIPDLEETVVSFESIDGGKVRVAITLVRTKADGWQSDDLRDSVYDEVFDNFVEFMTRTR